MSETPVYSPLPDGRQPRAACRTIDIHGHGGSPGVEKLVAGRAERLAEFATMAANSGEASTIFNRDHMLPWAGRRMASLDVRLDDLDRMGIDLQVVSPSPALYCYWAEPGLADDIVSASNEDIAALVGRAPDRLAGLGLVSLQHPEQAARQLEDAIYRHGLRGVEISASVGPMELSDPRLEPFFEAANALRAVVFIHPLGSSLGKRLEPFYLSNAVGQPVETAVALSHLIFSGMLDRYPDIRFLAAHGGGYLPYYIGRSVHAFRVRPEARKIARDPRDYLRQIWFDTVVFEPAIAAQLIDFVGLSQVVMGTDYPFDMGDYTPHKLVADIPGIDDAARAAILGGNAERLLGLA